MASGSSISATANGYMNGSTSTPTSDIAPSESYAGEAHDLDQKHQASSSSGYLVNGSSGLSYQTHNQEIIDHLYQAGFQTGNYADTILHVHQNAYRLHAIVLSRSPFLAHLMSTSPQHGGQRTIYVALEHEPEVTQEGFAVALGYLYSNISLTLINPDNARAVLAAGCLLGGMDDLCQYAYETCRRSITVESISSWLEFLDRIPLQPPSSPNGTSTPDLPVPLVNTVFGQYAQRIRDDVFNFLVITLPESLDVQGTADPAHSDGRQTILQIFSRVPFELFKAAVESPSFHIGSDQSRFKFAKDAIELRKRGIARGPGAEETVVLAFGGGSFGGSAVHVTRKMRKRPLWKVNA